MKTKILKRHELLNVKRKKKITTIFGELSQSICTRKLGIEKYRKA